MLPALVAAVKGGFGVVKKHQDRKLLKEKLAAKKDLSADEKERLLIEMTKESWKDEYVTVVFTVPIIVLMVAAIMGEAALYDRMIELMKTIPLYGAILIAIVGRAIGKEIRK